MSQSPGSLDELVPNDSYLKNFDALGAMIARGRSFSGRERHCCFVNTGDGRFSDVSAATGFDLIDDGRAVALVDWDNDGDQDLWITNRTAPRLRLLRNDFPANHHYLTLQLEGRTCNRDAIGARVEVHLDADHSGKIVRTLHAGDGFLSQSSKRLHFGLGEATSIERVVVRWPGSVEVETFHDVQPDFRYTLIQGSGEAVARDVTVRELAPSPPDIPPPTDRTRLVLAYRKPLPDIDYTNFQGQRQRLEKVSKRGMLINLWASWCAPCLEELHGWVAHEQELRELGLEIVALSTDDLTGNPAGDAATAKAWLTRSRWPFASGVATEPLVRALTLLHHQVVYRERPLSLPTSFLIDPQNRVSVIYQGPVSSEQIIKDVELLDASPERIAREAFPFPGKIGTRLFPRDSLARAKSYLEGGYFEDAQRQLQTFVSQNSATMGVADARNVAARARQLPEAYHLLAMLEHQNGQLDRAVTTLRHAVAVLPDQPTLRASLALALWKQGNHRDAHQQLKTVASLQPDNAIILRLVGETYTQMGQSSQAVEYFRLALQRQGDSIVNRMNLAVALQTSGQAADAIEQYREILRRQPKALEAANNLAWILATHGDEKLREHAEALSLAQAVIKSRGAGQANVLDTLAAALAANDQFEQATAIAEKAVELARTQKQTELADKIQSRLRLYRLAKPYREPAADAKE